MAECIERDAALEICETEYQKRLRMFDYCGDTVAWNIGHEIKALPAADVAPVVRGRWIGSHGLFQGKCSVCGYMTFDKSADWARNYWPYCPKCGARMNGDNGEEG